jgi:hypothetical protein
MARSLTVAALLILFSSTQTQAIDASHWVEVRGGAWHPDSTVLAQLDSALEPAVQAASKNRGQMREWSRYTFQYQGRKSLLGQTYVFVNAFCAAESADLRTKWMEVEDGGACYFSAKYDPKANRVYDVQVNGVA